MERQVAVIMRTKNRPHLLKRAIESVLNQLFQDWQLVIVNDGGEKAPVEMLCGNYSARLGDRLTLIHHDESKGMEAASNAGIEASSSTYIVVHDDDDSWNPEFLKTCHEYMESQKASPELGGVLTHWYEIYEKIKDEKVLFVTKKYPSRDLEYASLYRMSYDCFFTPISFFYKRAVFDEIGGAYDSELKLAGDWEFNLRFLKKFEIALSF